MARNAEGQTGYCLETKKPQCGNTEASGINEVNDQENNVMNDFSTSASSVIPFDFRGHSVRVVTINGEPWFVASDVCRVLEVVNTTQAMQALDDDERSMFNIGRQGEANIVNESGLYTLILRSRDAVKKGSKPHAFRKWVTAEVLPSIRKNGRYEDAEGKMNTLIGQTIGTDGFHMLGAVVKGKVSNLPAQVQRRATAKIWSQIHAAFGVRSAADLPAEQLDAARNFVAAYVVLEGEFLPKAQPLSSSTALSDQELYDVFFLMHHLLQLKRIYENYQVGAALRMLRSGAGVEMIDHFRDSMIAISALQKRLPDMEAAAVRMGYQPGTVMGSAA